MCAQNLTTYEIIIVEQCGVILFAKFLFLKKLERFTKIKKKKNVYGYRKIIFRQNFMKIAVKVKFSSSMAMFYRNLKKVYNECLNDIQIRNPLHLLMARN